MFPPDAKKLVAQAHDRFLKQMISEPKNKSDLPWNLDEEDMDVEMAKIMISFIRDLVTEVVEENNRLLIEALREKGIDL